MNISNLLHCFERDMRVKRLAKSTIQNYLSQVKIFLDHFKGKDSPRHINENDIKDWLLTAKEINSQRAMHSALKKFYDITVRQPMKFRYIPYAAKEQKLPVIFTVQEMNRMFAVEMNIKHRVILTILYSTGLRRDELLNLKWENINRNKETNRGYIHIQLGKGAKDRFVTLDKKLSTLLIAYYKEWRPKVYVLEGENGGKYSSTSVSKVLKQICKKAGISKNIKPHLIRHSFATHLFQSGMSIKKIQDLLGHANAETTAIYLHMGIEDISNYATPLEAMTA